MSQHRKHRRYVTTVTISALSEFFLLFYDLSLVVVSASNLFLIVLNLFIIVLDLLGLIFPI